MTKNKTTRHTMHTAEGDVTLARFDFDSSKGACHTILYRSAAGTAQSRDYKSMLTELIWRAGCMGLALRRVAVESTTTTKLSLQERSCPLEPKDAPSDLNGGTAMLKGGTTIQLNYLTAEGCDKLRRRIGTLAAKVGRPPGAKGGGNTHKTVRLYFDQPLTVKDVAYLAGDKKARAAA